MNGLRRNLCFSDIILAALPVGAVNKKGTSIIARKLQMCLIRVVLPVTAYPLRINN